MRRGRRLSWVGIYVYPCGNTAVAAGGIKQGQRVQSITVAGLTQPEGPGGPSPARRSRRVLLPGWDPPSADRAAAEAARRRSEARILAPLLLAGRPRAIDPRSAQYRKINCKLIMLFINIVRVESWYS